ncbi:uncharacterized protein LOC135470628 [Liolophura sinensis]|uniref:uncharacterized protein LOC135470628 n=1 Tax=Liolophura sinensis TaxID=3198878 RepID=UPI0031598C2E
MAERCADGNETNDRAKEHADSLLREFETWQETTGSDEVFLLESLGERNGAVTLSMLLSSEHEFKLHCPMDERDGYFKVDAEPCMTAWASTLNEYLVGSLNKLNLSDVLNKAVSLCSSTNKKQPSSEPDVDDEESDLEDDIYVRYVLRVLCRHPSIQTNCQGPDDILDDDTAFTTEWDLKVAQKKVRSKLQS